MLEIKPFTELPVLEIMLGFLFLVISVFTAIYIYKMRGSGKLLYGFSTLIIWTTLEFIDEFIVDSFPREIIFNIGGRIFLLIGIIFIIFGLKEFIENKK